MTVQAAFCTTLVDEWRRCGITDAVIAPGSRSTPLTLALLDGGMRLHVYLDERSAAFFALGIGMASGRPAIVLTTSGTAAAELTPAAVEAHHAGVPMLLCTADRPPELHEVGAPQTIQQDRLFEGVLRWRCDPGPAEAVPEEAWRSLAARAAAESVSGPAGPGPVHVNLAFRDPLVATAGAVPHGRDDQRPWHDVTPTVAAAPPAPPAVTSEVDGVIIAGFGCGEAGAVVGLSDALGWPVLADARSGVRGGGSGVIAAFDTILRHQNLAESLRPRVVVRLGAPPASKVLAGWLASAAPDGAPPVEVLVDPVARWADPDRMAHHVVRGDPTAVCRSWSTLIAPGARAHSPWRACWAAAETAAQGAIDAVIDGHREPTEPGVARTLTRLLGPDGTLVVSSSMPVRDVEWFGDGQSRARVLSNRGANGIDGVTSTALGVAAGSTGPTVALIGDLAFLHDLGGLLWARRRGVQLALVVVDNDGGGIFSFLPQAGALPPATFERLWGTPHGTDLSALASAFDIPVRVAMTADAVGPAVEDAIAVGGVRMVTVRTDRAANVAIHEQLERAVRQALDHASPAGR